MAAGPFTPVIRGYTQATDLHSTDAFVIDRIGVGTMYIEAGDMFATCIPYVIDGAGSAIVAGVAGDHWIPFACLLTGVTLLADQVGSLEIDLLVDTYANYSPTVADTIVGGNYPTITATTKYQDLTLTGWTVAIPAGSTLRYNVRSASTVTRVTVSLAASKVTL